MSKGSRVNSITVAHGGGRQRWEGKPVMSLDMDLIVCTSDFVNVETNVVTWRTTASTERFVVIVGDGVDSRPDVPICDSIPLHPSLRTAITFPGKSRLGPVGAMQAGYRISDADADILAFIHDDVIIHEQDWDVRVLREFEDPTVGVVGFGGATGLGTPGIYQIPYRLQQLARIAYASNVDDAEAHGRRFDGVRDVAVLDGFSLIVRRELLDKAGGWPTDKLIFHMYDAWLCLTAARLGYRIRLVGVKCKHLGGRTSTQAPYNEWLLEKHGKTDNDVHREAHEWIYEEFRDVLPLRATEGAVPAKATAANA